MSFDLHASIEAFGLSNRTVGALKNNDIHTLLDLLVVSDAIDISNLDGIGIAGAEEIHNFLDSVNYEGKDDGSLFASSNTSGTFGDHWKMVQPEGRNNELLVDYYNSGSKMAMQEFGEKHGVSRARIQQIIAKGTERLNSAYMSGVINEDIVSAIEAYANNRTEVHMMKGLDDVFTGVGIAYLVSSFRPRLYRVYTNRQLNGEWFIKADDNVGKVIDILIDELRHRPEPLLISEIEKLYSVSDEMLMSIKGIVEKDGYVTHESNKIATGTDRNRIITRYLEDIDRPASIMEIAKHTGLSENQVRGALSDKAAYVNVGKSVYDLVDRKYDDASVVDLAVKILTAENRALKIDTILEYVRQYKAISNLNISFILLNSSSVYHHDDYILLKGWALDKIEKKKKGNYYIALEDAVLEVINSSEEIFDFNKVREGLKKYGDTVSNNPNSIKATLVRLVDKNLISRVGGVRTGCYMRNNNGGNDTTVTTSSLRAKASLGSFINANIGKKIEMRYQTKRLNSAKRWRVISVRGQDVRYIYTNDLNNYGYRVKYLKERVVEYREHEEESVKLNKNGFNDSPIQIVSDTNWYEDVCECAKKLGHTFTLLQMYGFEEELSKKHPGNNNIRAKIRQQIQFMRKNGLIDMLVSGVYRKKMGFSASLEKMSPEAISKLVVGKEYKNDEIVEIFKVSSQGGMRKSNKTNSLVLIVKHRPDNPYDDRWNGDKIEYTGMGLHGDQSVDYLQNKTLAESRTNGVAVYLFESFANNQYIYRGIVELDGEPYFEIQKDESGENRRVVKFSLRLVKDQYFYRLK